MATVSDADTVRSLLRRFSRFGPGPAPPRPLLGPEALRRHQEAMAAALAAGEGLHLSMYPMPAPEALAAAYQDLRGTPLDPRRAAAMAAHPERYRVAVVMAPGAAASAAASAALYAWRCVSSTDTDPRMHAPLLTGIPAAKVPALVQRLVRAAAPNKKTHYVLGGPTAASAAAIEAYLYDEGVEKERVMVTGA